MSEKNLALVDLLIPDHHGGKSIARLYPETLGRLMDAARHQGQDEATSTLAVIAQIRELTGLGHRPMLSELPEAIASVLKSRSLAHAVRHAEDDLDHLSNMLFNSISDAVYATNDGVVFNLKRFIKTLGQRGFAITAAAPQPPRQDDRDEALEWFGIVFRDDQLKHEREEATDRLLATIPEAKP